MAEKISGARSDGLSLVARLPGAESLERNHSRARDDEAMLEEAAFLDRSALESGAPFLLRGRRCFIPLKRM